VEGIEAALGAGADVRLLLVAPGARDPRLASLLCEAQRRGVRVRSATSRVLTRLSVVRPAPDVLALAGRDPDADLPAMLRGGGPIWLLVGVAYPGNVGMVIRTAEVSGAEAVFIDAGFDHAARRAALRASMRADRFMPVRWGPAEALLDAVQHVGVRVLALDETGRRAPWEVDLTRSCALVVGGENGGIPPRVLQRCDERIRVPMAGFIPCYNLQAAVSALATERLRQLSVGPPLH
jgi:TrmH family RNA methyltransferase